MITLYGLRVPKNSIKEVFIDGGCYYAMTDDFIKINLDHDEILLVYKECPQVKDNGVFKRIFGCYDREVDGQEENV